MNKQAKAKFGTLIIIGIIVIAAIFIIPKLTTNFIITGSETMSRSSSVQSLVPGSTFTLTYTALGTSGDYGASVVDAVSGGCTPSNLQFVLTSPATTYQVTMTAPSSGSCTFHGDYKYGTFANKPFTDLTLNVCAPKTCSQLGKNCGSISDTCGGTLNCGTCQFGTCQSNICACTPSCTRPADLCIASNPDGCGGACTYTITKLTINIFTCEIVSCKNFISPVIIFFCVSYCSIIFGYTTFPIRMFISTKYSFM